MNEKHVTSLELSKALFEAGITKDFESEFYRVENTAIGSKDPAHGKVKHRSACCMVNGKVTSSGCIKYTPSLLLSELLELMPEYEEGEHQHPLRVGKDYAGYENEEYSCGHNEVGETAMEALSSLATHLLREGKFNNNAK